MFTFCVNDVSAAPGDTIYVNGSGGNDSWDGLSSIWNGTSGPKNSIKNAIETVNNGGTVDVADGTYTGVNNTNIVINRNMTIQGQSKYDTIINGTDTRWFFKIQEGTTVTIKNLTLTNGFSFNGRGVICNEGDLSLIGCYFCKSSAQYDTENGVGTIYNKGDLLINETDFTDNSAVNSDGGAIYNDGNLGVFGSSFQNNDAYGSGGAIYNDGVLLIVESYFAENIAFIAGGAIYNNGILAVTQTMFLGNAAGGAGDPAYSEIAGGAIYNEYGAFLTVDSCDFIANIPQDIYNNTDPSLDFDGVKNTNNTVKAASKSVKMLNTGLPLNFLILAILMIIGGLLPGKK